MFYGVLQGGQVLLVKGPKEGRPVAEASMPDVPNGYKAVASYVDSGSSIQQVWSLVPVEGSAQDAAVALAKMQAASLADTEALKVAALYDEWSGDGVAYERGDRCRFQGTLVKCLQAHTSQPDWSPNAAAALWTVILPGQDGSCVEVGVWQQPESTNPYGMGDRVIFNGHLWESTHASNVWRPGDVGAPWTDLGEWDGGTTAGGVQ